MPVEDSVDSQWNETRREQRRRRAGPALRCLLPYINPPSQPHSPLPPAQTSGVAEGLRLEVEHSRLVGVVWLQHGFVEHKGGDLQVPERANVCTRTDERMNESDRKS